jgi:flagellar P-ring protein FlgI
VDPLAALTCGPAAAKSRIKDIVDFEGARENVLIGSGLVTGLAGTGDSLRNCPMTRQMIEAMSERQGANVRETNLNTKNTAHVQVTAKLPPFASPGSEIDVTVSASCDAKSLLGGTLIGTALIGADGEAYVFAQGTVQTGSISASGASGSSVTKGVPTSGRIAGGGIVEKDNGYRFASLTPGMALNLRNPDFTTALRVADAINTRFPGSASAQNLTVVAVRPPPGLNLMNFISAIENLEVTVDSPAKVVIDEVGGVIVAGEAVRISTVSIMQGNLTVTVQESPQASQPAPFSRGGETVVVPQTQLSVAEETGRQFMLMKDGGSAQSLVTGLNALGVTVRDMILILQSLKRQGALQAEIEVL